MPHALHPPLPAFKELKMKRLGVFLFIMASAFLLKTGEAAALSFTDLVNFQTADHSYTTVAYTASQSSGFEWEHSLLDNFAGKSLDEIQISDLELEVIYSQTHSAESWSIENAGNLISSSPMTQSKYILSGNWKDDLNNDWSIRLKVLENTSGADSFRIFSSKLSGNYQVKSAKTASEIPEPGVLALLTGGLGMLRLLKSGRAHDVAQR